MPAAAVIPAPIVYIKVVAVKKLVVGSLSRVAGLPPGHVSGTAWTYLWDVCLHLTVWHDVHGFYFDEIRMLQTGMGLEYVSMEYYYRALFLFCWFFNRCNG